MISQSHLEEEPFKFYIPGCPIPVIGAIDLVEEDEADTLIITDFKTSSRAYSNAEVDKNFQLTLYQMLQRKTDTAAENFFFDSIAS